MKLFFILAVAAATLTGCAKAPYFDLRAEVTPAFIAGLKAPMILFELPDKPYAATATGIGTNGPVTTWSTIDSITVSLADGVLTATRGMGTDLMHSDVSGTVAALAGGPRIYDRAFSYQDAENHTVLRAQRCTMTGPVSQTLTLYESTYATQIWTEICGGNDQTTPNRYWLSNGRIVQSHQFVGADIGSIIIEAIN